MASVETESKKTEPSSGDCTKEDVQKAKRPESLCCYSQKECHLKKLKGFDFCHEHILEDKASPFKPCSFISKTTGKRCPNPAPNVSDREKTYCLIHTKDSDLRKVVEERSKKKKRKHGDSEDFSEISLVTKGAQSNNNGKNVSKRHKTVEEDYKRDEMLRVDSSWHGDHESDTESLDNEMDDPLRHAGVWTAEEVTKVCRDKLLRLRSLYMAQFERLKHVFKNKRRKYLIALKADEEGETHGNKKEPALSAFDIATKSYNRRRGAEALLLKESKEKRSGISSRSHQILPHQRCTHYIDGNRCLSKIIPYTKFCVKHICQDPNQLLFLPCSQILGEDEHCGKPVPNVLNHDKCLLHLPHLKELSESHLKEELEEARKQELKKEKEREERSKAALEEKGSASRTVAAPTTHSTSDSTHSVKPKDEPKNLSSCALSTVSNNNNLLPRPITPWSGHTLNGASPIPKGSPGKQPQSPTTNLQIRIEPLKKPEIVFTDFNIKKSSSALEPSSQSPKVQTMYTSGNASASGVRANQMANTQSSGNTSDVPPQPTTDGTSKETNLTPKPALEVASSDDTLPGRITINRANESFGAEERRPSVRDSSAATNISSGQKKVYDSSANKENPDIDTNTPAAKHKTTDSDKNK